MVFECHGHIMLDGVSYTNAVARHKNGVDEAFVRNNLQINADQGITFYRDGGDKFGVSVFARKIAHEYGIDYRSPSFLIHKKGFYGGMFGRDYTSMAEYRILIKEAAMLGADYIKLTASGMLDFNEGSVTGHAPDENDLRETIKIAHGEGFSTMVHVNGSENIKMAAEAGADSIEHGFFIDDDGLNILKQAGTVWVPTCVAVANHIGKNRFNDDVLRRIIDNHKTSMRKAKKLGLLVASGSDAGASGVIPGIGTLDELEVFDSIDFYPGPGNKKIEEVFKRA